MATTAMRNRPAFASLDDADVAGVAVDDVADPAEELLGEEAVLLDGRDLVPQPAQLERRGRAEPAEPDDEDVVVVGCAACHRDASLTGVVGPQPATTGATSSVQTWPYGTSVVWDEVFTAYDFGPTHPMAPVRLDLTTRLARSLGVLDHVDPAGPRASPTTTCSPPCTTATTSRPCTAPRPTPRSADVAPRAWAPTTTPPSPACTRPRPGSPRAPSSICRGRVAGRHRARRQLLRRPAPRDARLRQRVLHLQRHRRRHPVAARPRRPAGRLRRHRRAPRRRRRADVLERPAGAHDLGARERPAPLPRHRLAGRHRRPVRRAARSPTSPCRRAPATPPGCARSSRSCRRWCGPSPPTCSSPSTAATPTCTTPWPTSPSPSTPSAAPTRRCTTWRTRRHPAAGSRSAVAATSSSRSCRARGPT